MRVQVTSEEKKFLTVAEMPAVRRIIQDMKEDECPLEEYADMVMCAIKGTGFEIYRPKAVISKNCRINDRYFDGSGALDVWITFLAFDSYFGAYDCGVYLSDVWELTDDNHEELRSKMYVKAFTNGR